MREQDCAIVILAAGLSKRFGAEDKLMAMFKGKALAWYSLEAAGTIDFGFKFIVTSSDCKIGTLKAALPYKGITNPNPSLGQGGSIVLGAKAVLETHAKAAIFILADMPFITGDYLRLLLSQARSGEPTASIFKGQILPPILFSRKDLRRAVKLDHAASGKDLLGPSLLTIELPDMMGIDIDTKDDLRHHS